MKKYLKKAGILMLLPLAAACVSTESETAPAATGKSQTYNVKTSLGDRVTFNVVGNPTDGYNYHGRIRHTTRASTDPLDRQRVLNNATQTIIAKLCGADAKATQPSYTSNNYEGRGRFVCTGK